MDVDGGPVLRAAPPERIDLDGGQALVRPAPELVPAAVVAINESLEHLAPWMIWAQAPATEASIGEVYAEGAAPFEIPGIERVRIRCAEDNVRSARVPAKLGFEDQGIEVPPDGPCAGVATRRWEVARADWMTSAS